MADGFAVDRAALAETAQGLNEVIDQLKGLGLSESGDVGRGFSQLALSGAQAGNGNLAGAFSEFCARWSWGVRALVQDGNQFAQRLGLSAGTYDDAESQATGALKDLTASVVGDPNLTGQQAQASSWKQDAGMVTMTQSPEGAKSPQQDVEQMKKQWEGVGETALSSPLAAPGLDILKAQGKS
jgi:hypothetical protein